MNNACSVALGLLLSTLPACAPDTLATKETDTVRGAQLLAPFKQALKQALVDGMQQGPIDAISVCKLEAPAIAAAHSVAGVRMGRTSHRLRNPANVGPDWVEPILRGYLDEQGDVGPRTVVLPEDRVGYVEPIALQPLCVTCHGTVLASDVAAQIERDYPDDRAIGFEVGDLRGVFWVEFPAGD